MSESTIRQLQGEEMLDVFYKLASYAFHPSPPLTDRETWQQWVVAGTHPENPASNGLLIKLGFPCLGGRHHTYDDLPKFENQVLWAITQNSWRI